MKLLHQRWQCSYCINVTVFCMFLFMLGFFPMKQRSGSFATEQDMPTSLKEIRLRKEKLYIPSVSKTVFIVIDALRYDFVEGVKGSTNMPFISQLLNMNKACLLKTRANPPTVTMPRIKALTTGTVPNFIDVVLNLGSSKIQDDSIIHQAARIKKIVFYGDDTWLKLYPEMFTRSEGTTSFYVSDYTEVDNNVTKKVKQELSGKDWDIMILHYLGLDHIGHLEGPRSPLVQPKLQEMDNIIKMIYNHLQKYEIKGNDSSLIVICGDHGMKDTGSHGGASLGEVLTPVVTLGLNCPEYNKEELLQINVASTLSVLWGLPLPADNVGHVIIPLLHKYSLNQKLYVLYYNAQQLLKMFLRNGGNSDHDGYKMYHKAVEMHYKWLLNSSNLITEQHIISFYQETLCSMSTYLAELMVRYDVPVLTVAIIIQVQIFFIMVISISDQMITRKTIVTVISLFIMLISSERLYCQVTSTETLMCSSILITANCCFITSLNITLVIYNRFIFRYIQQLCKHWCLEVLLLGFGQCLFLLSLTSSSLIEEEHQIWYFLWTTVCVMFSLRLQSFLKWFLIACVHRVLCKLNQTGDKWAHLPDIADWLSQTDHSYTTFSLLLGLVCIYCCSWFKSHAKKSKWMKPIINILTMAVVASIYLYKTASCNNISFFSYKKSRGTHEIQVFWTTFSALFVSKLIYIVWSAQKKIDISTTELKQCLCNVSIVSWMFICSLLLRPHNVILLPALYMVSHVLVQYLKTNQFFTILSTLLHHWLGMVFFFYQGNSNSLSSIDIAAGYAGLSDYNFYYVGSLLFIHTYAAPVLAFLLNLQAVVNISNNNWRAEVTRCLSTLILQQIVHIVVYLCFITSQRYHLFVWTVFSPKLLYLGSQTLLYMFLINCTQLLILCTNIIK